MRARSEIQRYLESTSDPRLHLGCGGQIFAGWLNADLYEATFLDVTEPFPIPDCTIAFIYHEHVIEHLSREQTLFMLGECHRVLRPHGVMRISCPDFGGLVRRYLDTPAFFLDTPIFKGHAYADLPTAQQRLCELLYGFGHRWMWDHESLAAALSSVGFSQIEARTFGESPYRELAGLDRERRRDQSLYVEAKRLD